MDNEIRICEGWVYEYTETYESIKKISIAYLYIVNTKSLYPSPETVVWLFPDLQYIFLKSEVDKWADELYRLDAHPNVVTNLWVARKELKKFTSKKRKEGVNI